MTKIIEGKIKTDVVAVVQRNYIENKLAEEKTQKLAKRNSKARAYIRSCKRKRNQIKKDRCFAICTGVVCAALMFTLVSCYKPTTPTETEPSRPMSCKVVETRGELVTVECRGEIYSFYGDGFSEGEMITCYFTDNKIIKTER